MSGQHYEIVAITKNRDGLRRGSANFFCIGSDSKYFWLSLLNSAFAVSQKRSHTMFKWMNITVLMKLYL